MNNTDKTVTKEREYVHGVISHHLGGMIAEDPAAMILVEEQGHVLEVHDHVTVVVIEIDLLHYIHPVEAGKNIL